MSVFVPGKHHDLFVSYAHVNNQPPAGGDVREGWCGRLVEELKRRLSEEIGRADSFDIWMDRRLTGNEPFSDDIRQALQGAATLLVFLSKGYLASQWCLDELKMFVDACGGERAIQNQLFVVRLDELDDENLPPVVQRSRIDGFMFYRKDPLSGNITRFAEPIPIPSDSSHKPFYQQVRVLAKQVADALQKQLERSQLSQSVQESLPDDGQAATVFFAEVPQDLFDLRLEVASYLQQSRPPIRVAPDPNQLLQWSSESPAEILGKTESHLEDSVLFVQMLGRFSTPRTEGFPSGYAEAQRECALAAGKPVLRWRSRELDLNAVPDAKHKQNLQAHVDAMRLDELKRTIVSRVKFLTIPPPTPEGADVTEGGGYVLINAQKVDMVLADQIAGRLADSGVGYDIEEGDAPISDLVKKYDYDALMVVYGDCDPNWVPRQVRKFREMLLAAADAAPKCAVYIAPPPDEHPLRCRLPRMFVLDHDIDQQLAEFAVAIRKHEDAE